MDEKKHTLDELVVNNIMTSCLEAAYESIVITDTNGVIKYVNSAFKELTGYSEKEVLGEKPSILRSGNHSQEFYSKLWDTLLKGGKWSGEVINKKKNGSFYTIKLSLAPIKNEVGSVLGFIAIQNDMTEIKDAQVKLVKKSQSLKEKNKELEKFAAIAAHDLKSPLTLIKGFSEMLKEFYHSSDNKDIHLCVEKIENATYRMKGLIDDLLNYSKLDAKDHVFKEVSLNHIIKDIFSNYELVLSDAGGKLIKEDLPHIRGNTSQLKQLFDNLISNAIKYQALDTTPLIKVSCDINKDKNLCQIMVEDNGIGFEQIDKDKVFEAFERLNTKGEYEGTGLGLAICKKIVESHCGTISVESEPDRGSVFTVSLPLT